MRLSEDKREELKSPKGILFEESEKAFEYYYSQDYEMVITVGDIVSSTFLKEGIKPGLMIVDYTVERSPVDKETRKLIEDYDVPTVKVDNPPGHLSEELLNVLENFKNPPMKILIEGEEDLATIPATLEAPNGSLVVYGQPGTGLVFVEVNEKKKEEFGKLLDLLTEVS